MRVRHAACLHCPTPASAHVYSVCTSVWPPLLVCLWAQSQIALTCSLNPWDDPHAPSPYRPVSIAKFCFVTHSL